MLDKWTCTFCPRKDEPSASGRLPWKMKATGISTGGRDHALLPPITPTSLDCTSTVSADCSKTLAAGYEFPVVSALTLKSCSALSAAIRFIPKNDSGTFAIQRITPSPRQVTRATLEKLSALQGRISELPDVTRTIGAFIRAMPRTPLAGVPKSP